MIAFNSETFAPAPEQVWTAEHRKENKMGTKMEKIVKELREAMKFGIVIRRQTKEWEVNSFLSLIGTLVDQRAADDGVEAGEYWDVLYQAQKDVNASEGPMKATEV